MQDMIENIERQSDKGFGPNPVAQVKCPHCGGTMQAIDAKAHVRTQPFVTASAVLANPVAYNTRAN